MALIIADRVRDTTTTTGTGNVTVTGTAPITYRTFSAVCSVSDTFPYFIASRTLNEWEVGLATYTSSNTIARTLIFSSSNSGSIVSFSAGTKDVVLSQTAEKQGSGNYTVTSSMPFVDWVQSWNNGSQLFTGIKANITDIASATGSNIIDLQVGSVSQFKVDKTGVVVSGNIPVSSNTGVQFLCDNKTWATPSGGGPDFPFNPVGIVADGVTDNAAVLEATIGAVADGTDIALPPGIIGIGSAGLQITNRNRIRFLGGTIKLLGPASNPVSSMGDFAIVFTDCTDCGFVNTTFIGNNQGGLVGFFGCNQSGMWQCDVSGAGTGNAQFVSVGGTNTQIIGNYVHDVNSLDLHGIWIGNTNLVELETGAHIIGNTVYNHGATGIVSVGSNAVIAENHCSTNAGSGIIVSGVDDPVVNSFNVVIADNVCDNNGFSGIQSDDGGASSRANCPGNILVVGNICYLNAESGIFANNSNNWNLSNNTCYNNGSHGITCVDNVFNCLISGNNCYDTRIGGARTQGTGISVIANVSADTVQNVTIVGNNCSNHADAGIFVQANSTFIIRNPVVTGNNCFNNATYGIFFAESIDGNVIGAIVDGNNCFNNSTADIRLTAMDVTIGSNVYGTEDTVEYADLVNNSTLPNVYSRKYWRANNGSATSITNFTTTGSAPNGQELTIYGGNGNTTLIFGILRLKGNVDVNLPQDGFITLRLLNGTWYELSRSF